ncbi:phosphoribosylamine--glycine ligase [bacterium]|nr:phosphoribosylamine--glycine ligase [candidate division CSSED10-310 bacterium]
MKILVIGSGGREHALAWKLRQSPLVSELLVAPGNAGISRDARCIPVQVNRMDDIVELARQSDIDLVVVGPEAPLSLGLTDKLMAAGINVFGPTACAARLESSKAFAKDFCLRHSIPTASFGICLTKADVLNEAEARRNFCVIKADGLAAGKGVFVCRSFDDVESAIRSLFDPNQFGTAASKIIVEDLLDGEEVSILAIADGNHYVILDTSQDHKAAYDNDKGPNTGGMGAYSPAPVVTPSLMQTIENTIIQPAVQGMKSDGTPFSGVLYAGLMIVNNRPEVLEFNVRFGDPETQPLLMRLDSDLAELLSAAASGHLNHHYKLKWSSDSAVCVIMASGGYPGVYEKGFPITGLDEVEAVKDMKVFHAGTAFDETGNVVSSGGRVIGITAKGKSVRSACDLAYKTINKINFKNCFYRTDIAHRALARDY